MFIFKQWAIGLMSRVFANGLEDRGSIPVWVIPETQKMVLDAALLNAQHYKVRINGKVELSREWSKVLLYAFEFFLHFSKNSKKIFSLKKFFLK